MSSAAHLLPEVARVLQADDHERIEFCRQDRWVAYPAARAAIDRLDDLHDHPRSLRMPNILIVARSGNGKSSILETFMNRHPVTVDSQGDPVAPIAHIEVPASPTVSSLCSEILWSMGVGHREKDSSAVKVRQVKSIMRYSRVRMLLIDEFNNIAEAGREARDILALIRSISNDLKIVIGAAGTQAAINALNQDPQLKSRFQPIPIPAWKLGRPYLQFLAAYERLLPLEKPSNLASAELAPILHGMCGEAIGDTVKFLKEAAVQAIRSGQEQVTLDIIKSVQWTPTATWKDVALVL
jgi:hypothetical protein